MLESAYGLQKPLQALDDDVQSDAVVAALGDDEVCPSLGRLDELEVHRPYTLVVLGAHGLEVASALPDISSDPSEDADVGVRVDIELYVERVAKSRRPALALVSNETCEGCRVGIPAQNYIEILKGEQLIVCGNCRRILLHPDMVSSAGG